MKTKIPSIFTRIFSEIFRRHVQRRFYVIFIFSLWTLSVQSQDQCKVVGWATQNGGTTGGGNATPVTVTSMSSLNSAAGGTNAAVIYVKGTLSGRVKIGSNKTIFGLPGAKIVGGVDLSGSKNVIVRNLIVQGPGAVDVDGIDCFSINNSTTNVWVDHCEIYDGQDGNLDIANASNYITITWTKFRYTSASDNHMFSCLFGNSDSKTSDRGKIKVTMQYCWFADGVQERMPRVRFGQVHVVNNLFSSSDASTCVRAGREADLLVESNAFVGRGTAIDLYENDFKAVLARNNIGASNISDGTAFTPPYSLTITPAAQVEPIVRSGAGATLTSPNCGGNTNTPPTVSITSPANNASFTAPASVTINASAADANGTVTNVQFYNGSTLLGSDASSPYSFNWTNVAAGTYTLTARATDNNGAVTTSSPVTVVVNAVVNTPPTVSINSPANNANFNAPAAITINANAADANGTVSNVQFYNGSTLLGSDGSSPYSFNWTNVAAGTYTLTARATDNNGAVTTSSAVTVVVNAVVNTPPTVSITSPANNASFTAPAFISINANAADANGTVSNVQFYNGSTLLGSDGSSPYSFNWANVASGTYTLTARATDNNGAVTTSSPVTVVVNSVPNNNSPVVSIASPANGSSYSAPASITFNANATDNDGTISNVQFYNGGALIGSSTTSPYSFTWNNVGPGTYSITARATDNAGAVAISSAINITVTGITTGTTTIQAETACSADGIENETKNAGFNGTGYINLDNETGTDASWAVNSSSAQTVTLSIRYANASTISRDMSLQLNDVTQVATINFPSTGAWTSWANVNVQVNLASGFNMIRLVSLTNEGAPNIDELVYNSSEVSAASDCTPPAGPDCAGVSGGSAKVDNCQVCSGGTTGIIPNSTCTQDCNGVWGGTAYLDNCATCVGGNTGRVPCVPGQTTTIQAEMVCSADGIENETKNAGFNGSGYVNLDNETGTEARWAVNSSSAQTVTLSIRYANASTVSRNMSLQVNNVTQVATIDFPSTGEWTIWTTVNVQVSLVAGFNMIALVSLTDEGAPNIDELIFNTSSVTAASGCTPPPPPDCAGVPGGTAKVDNCQICSGGTTGIAPNSTCVQDCNGIWGGTAYRDDCGICVGGTTGRTACIASDAGVIQAETACSVAGIKSETKNAGYNGAGYVNLNNATGTSAIWGIYSPSAQTATLTFRYANESSNNRRAEIRVNGITQVPSVDFISTGSWTSWSTVNVTVTFTAGDNQLQLVSLMNEGAANIDEISFTTGKLSAGGCISASLAAAPSSSNVYPNPSTDAFSLEATEYIESFVVVNGMGTVVYQGRSLEEGEPVSFGDSLPSGIYTLHIVYSTGRTEQKIIHKYM